MQIFIRTALAVAAGVFGASPAMASVYGSLANFDAVNDTGEIGHGFEIDIEDASFDHTKITSVFGLDRNFGVPPTSVERYGAPSIVDQPGVGVSIRYQALATVSRVMPDESLREVEVAELPLHVLPYLSGSRYIESELIFQDAVRWIGSSDRGYRRYRCRLWRCGGSDRRRPAGSARGGA